MNQIILLDDSHVSSLMISTIIKSAEFEANLHQPSNPKDAEKICADHATQVLIIDLHMPGQNPVITAYLFNDQFDIRHSIVIGKPGIGLEEECRALGYKFIGRPVNEKSVLKAITPLLETKVMSVGKTA